MTTSPNEHSEKAPSCTTVFYDGACPLCTVEIGYYRDRDTDRRLTFVDVSKPDAALPSELNREQALARFHIQDRNADLLSGAAAFVEVWRNVPGWRWAARLARFPGVLLVLEGGYRVFLKLRPSLVALFQILRRRRHPTKG